MDDTLQGEFADLKGRLEEWTKGKRGAPIFRAFVAKLNEMFEQMTGGKKHQNPPTSAESATDRKDAKEQKSGKEDFQEMEIKKLCTLLGLPETATEEEVLAKITELTTGAGAIAAAIPEAMSKEFTSLKETVKAQATTISALQHGERVAKFQKVTSTFSAVPGKPEELAEELARLEETAGIKTADAILATYQHANKAGEAALLAVGTSKKGEKAVAFEDKVQAYSKANPAVSRADAVKATMRAEPDLYRESVAQ